MSGQRSTDHGADATVPIKRSTYPFASEFGFQKAVEDLAKEHDWEPFHIPARAYEAGIPHSGFPDLVLRYWDENGCTMIVAELKHVEQPQNEEDRERRRRQEQFLRDFSRYGIPAFLFYPRHWDYIAKMLKNGPPEATGDIIEPCLPIVRSVALQAPLWDENRVIRTFLRETAEFHHSSRGELAELRRMNLEEPNAATYWRLMARARRLGDPATESKWAFILHGIALMTPNAHGGISVGKALFEGGDSNSKQAFYSNLRFNRLLNARGRTLMALLSELFRMMGTAGQPLDWYEMASFILHDDEESREKARRQMAQDYFTAEYERNG